MSKQAPQQQPPKRGLTLDLSSGAAPSSRKKVRLATPGNGAPPILTTPDVQMLKLSSPELAKFIEGNNGLPTPTPSGYAFPKTVTEEQELYAKGFEDALKNMHSGGKGSNAAAIATIEKATAAHAQQQQKQAGAGGASQTQDSSNLIMAASAIAEQPPLPVSVSSRPSSSASGSVDGSSDGSYVVPDTIKVNRSRLLYKTNVKC